MRKNRLKSTMGTHRKPLVSIVVVTHEHKEYIDACITSLFSQRSVSFEVVLVDNASYDGTAAYVRKHFPNVKVIAQNKRYGFATNVNTGIRRSRGEYVLVLNPDTYMHQGALVTLIRCFRLHPRAGICGPKLINPDGSVQMSYRNFPTWRTALFRRTPLRRWFPLAPLVQKHLNVGKNHHRAQRAEWMLGACLLLRRTMLNDIGLFDEGYRLYVEDIDLCLRAHLAGWEVWYEPGAVVTHEHVAKSDRTFLSLYSYYHTTSMLRYALKYWRRVL